MSGALENRLTRGWFGGMEGRLNLGWYWTDVTTATPVIPEVPYYKLHGYNRMRILQGRKV